LVHLAALVRRPAPILRLHHFGRTLLDVFDLDKLKSDSVPSSQMQLLERREDDIFSQCTILDNWEII
jgi:hypothetical protein